MHKHLLKASELAKTHQYDERMSFKLCAVIARGGNILSVGYNSLAVNSFIDYSISKANLGSCRHIAKHAEVDAILKVRKKIDLRGAKIYVARVRPRGEMGMARPCTLCQHVLGRFGINRAFFTIDHNSFGIMKVMT